jgi:hypothetical protein
MKGTRSDRKKGGSETESLLLSKTDAISAAEPLKPAFDGSPFEKSLPRTGTFSTQKARSPKLNIVRNVFRQTRPYPKTAPTQAHHAEPLRLSLDGGKENSIITQMPPGYTLRIRDCIRKIKKARGWVEHASLWLVTR